MTKALVEELRAGLAGTTPGPWRECGGATPSYRAVHSPSGYIIFGMADADTDSEVGAPIQAPDMWEQGRNARHIARCSPENIAALLDHIEAISSAAANLTDLAEGFIPLCDQNSKLEKACKAMRALLRSSTEEDR